MSDAPLILEIKGNSLDDGPGIRTVVFFKGCPLDCAWCHNPESKSRKPEISFDAKACIGCGTCLDICTKQALSRDLPYFIDRSRCNLCFDCVAPCPSEALSMVGQVMSLDEIMQAVLKDKPFFKTSGGGVTLSGGEPLGNMPFVSDMMQQLNREDIPTLIETCGLFNFQNFETLILPYVHTIYMDLKLIDPDAHIRCCGTGNEVILNNLVKIHRVSLEKGFEFLPRVPLVPGVTDTVQNLEGIAAFLKEHDISHVQLLAYNPLWHEKCDKIGVENKYRDQERMTRWLPKEKINASKEMFKRSGINVI